MKMGINKYTTSKICQIAKEFAKKEKARYV